MHEDRCAHRALPWIAAGLITIAVRPLTAAPAAGRSPYYEYNVIAEVGQAGLTGMGDQPSINDFGVVAFVGKVAGGEKVFVGEGVIDPKPITTFLRTYGRAVQINNQGQVVSRDQISGAPVLTQIRVWDSSLVDSFQLIATGGDPPRPYASVLAQPSINNAGLVAFSAIKHGAVATVLASPDGVGFHEEFLTVPLRPQIADGGWVAARAGNPVSAPIRVYQMGAPLATRTVAASADFSRLGLSAGISDDGEVVAFYGDLTASGAARFETNAGPGIFLALTNPLGTIDIVRVAGREEEIIAAPGGDDDGECEAGESCRPFPELGLNDSGDAIGFASFDLDNRVGVTLTPLGRPGFDDDSLTVAFLATPSAPSRDNPHLPGEPQFFSAGTGLFTVRVDVDEEIAGFFPSRVYHPTGAIAVAQIGDLLDGDTISRISVFDPIARASSDLETSLTRTQRRGDHRVAFLVDTTAGSKIVRASLLDSDQDGLLDHWERTGIDVEGDGVPELELSKAGADPFKRDLFLEVDWVQADATSEQPHVHEPPPGSLTFTVSSVLDEAPALRGDRYGFRSSGGPPDDIPAGIALHVDQGPGTERFMGSAYSRRMGTLPLDGGDQIAAPPGIDDIDVIHFGKPGRVNLPGITAVSLDEVKRAHFGSGDRNARELAFRYAVYTDFQDVRTPSTLVIASAGPADFVSADPLPADFETGDAVKIAGGTGEGQVRTVNAIAGQRISVDYPWSVPPDASSTFAILAGYGGIAEVAWRPSDDFHPFPGNDYLVTKRGFGVSEPDRFLGTPCSMWRTATHELGHTLGLRHGGTDHFPNKGLLYESIMSYSWTQDCSIGGPVQSYADASDITFDDWANLRMDFAYTFNVGNSFAFQPARASAGDPEPTVADYEAANGPIDLIAPVVTVLAPAAGSSTPPGIPITVRFRATDNVAVVDAGASLDLDGDGEVALTERVVATLIAPDTYEATLPGPSGPFGTRVLRAFATDTSQSLGVAKIDVNISNNQPPTAAAGGPYQGDCMSTLIDGATADDPDGDELLFRWDSSNPDVTVSPSSGTMPAASGPRVVPPSAATLDAAVPACGITATLTLTVTDTSGEDGVATTVVTFLDDLPPTLNVPGAATFECQLPIGVPSTDPAVVTWLGTATAMDTCRPPSLSNDAPAFLPFTCGGQDTTVSFTANDGCNEDVRSSIATVTDSTPPALSVPAPITLECNAHGGVPLSDPQVQTWLALATANDACSTFSLTHDAPALVASGCSPGRPTLVSFTTRDACGNSNVLGSTTTVVDTTPPTIAGVPADATVECDAVPPPATPTATDVCDPAPALRLVESRIDGSCPDSYSLERTWTATDNCASAMSATQTLTVRDRQAPLPFAQLRPLAPLPPRPPSSVCAPPTTRAFEVVCQASDNCDPTPRLTAALHVTHHDVLERNGACTLRHDVVPVTCGEHIELQLLAPPCPSKPRAPRPSMFVNSQGFKVVTGEVVVLEVTAEDRCGHLSTATDDPASHPSPLCDERLEDGTCCPAVAAPEDGKCKVPVCGRSASAVLPAPQHLLPGRQRRGVAGDDLGIAGVAIDRGRDHA